MELKFPEDDISNFPRKTFPNTSQQALENCYRILADLVDPDLPRYDLSNIEDVMELYDSILDRRTTRKAGPIFDSRPVPIVRDLVCDITTTVGGYFEDYDLDTDHEDLLLYIWQKLPVIWRNPVSIPL